MARMPRISRMPRIPRMTGMTGMSGMSGVAGVSGMSGVAGVAWVSGMSGVAGMARVSGMSRIAGVARVARMSWVAGMARVAVRAPTGIAVPVGLVDDGRIGRVGIREIGGRKKHRCEHHEKETEESEPFHGEGHLLDDLECGRDGWIRNRHATSSSYLPISR